MEIRVLRYFLEAAREGNMTRAADRLFISQPTMSKQLKELEKELGAKLFVRSNYSIRLTEAGMLLRERAEDILALVDRTLADFQSLEDSFRGEIYVGAPESESMLFFAEAVRDLQKEHPGIRCNIYSGNMEDVCEKLDKGILDLAIILSYADLTKYSHLVIPSGDRWGILMRKDDPLAGRQSFTAQDLKKMPLICSRQWVDQEFPRWFGPDPEDVNIVATYNLAYNGSVMARAGIGYTVLLDRLVDTGERSDLTFRPLDGVPGTDMNLIWRKKQVFSPAAKLVLKVLREKLRDTAGPWQ